MITTVRMQAYQPLPSHTLSSRQGRGRKPRFVALLAISLVGVALLSAFLVGHGAAKADKAVTGTDASVSRNAIAPSVDSSSVSTMDLRAAVTGTPKFPDPYPGLAGVGP